MAQSEARFSSASTPVFVVGYGAHEAGYHLQILADSGSPDFPGGHRVVAQHLGCSRSQLVMLD